MFYEIENQKKWLKHYLKLCLRGLNRELPETVYVERHHIFPISMFGKNNLIVKLTAQEHFIAHQLLVKIFPNNRELIYAARMMTINDSRSQKRHNNKMYGWLKEKYSKLGQTIESNKKRSKALKGGKQSEETKRKKSKSLIGHRGWNKGGTRPDYIKEILRQTHLGKPKTKEHRRKLSEAKKGKSNGPHSEETKRKISESHTGIKMTPQEILTCPYCNKSGGIGNMKRYHFNNCKTK